MMRGFVQLSEPSIDIVSNKTIDNLYPIKLIKENIKGKTVNILLKIDYTPKDMFEALEIGNKVSLNIKNNKQFDSNGNISSQDIESIDNLTVVYSYTPIFNKGVLTDYIFVLSTDENLPYNIIMKLVEREEKQQLNSSIYKNRPTDIAFELKNTNANLEELKSLLDKKNNDLIKEISKTLSV